MASPTNPDLYRPIQQWPQPNIYCYRRFRRWLRQGGYSESALSLYSCAVRLAFSQVDKPYWQIGDEELDSVRALIHQRYESAATRQGYFKGLAKLAEFLRQANGLTAPPQQVNWVRYLAGLPDWLAADIRRYLRHRSRAWLLEEEYTNTTNELRRLTTFLRWLTTRQSLTAYLEVTPDLWYAYLDERLAAAISAKTLNNELGTLQSFLHYLVDRGQAVCERLLRVERLKEHLPLPRDVPPEQLRQVYQVIETAASAENPAQRFLGIMDRAWFLLMLHSGLRTGEVRRLHLSDLDMDGQRVRIEQSKGLKDRLVYISQAAIAALEAYLPLRGPLVTDHVFVYRHKPLSRRYCADRLRGFSQQCGLKVTPHQLRHSCATLLLNAGTPILTVQTLLGHKQIDTTLRYARLYDGTVAADYYRAMVAIEQRLQLTETAEQPLLNPAQLVALVDALSNGTLNESQRQLVHDLRSGLLALAQQEEATLVAASGLSG